MYIRSKCTFKDENKKSCACVYNINPYTVGLKAIFQLQEQ